MRKFLTWLLIALVIAGAGQATLASSQPQDERDFAVDHAIGGLKKGSRMLAPKGQGAGQSHSKATKPGGAISPRDAGTVTSGSRGAGGAKSGGEPRSIGEVGSPVGIGPSPSTGGGTQTSGTHGGTDGGTGPGATEEPSGVGGSEATSEPPAGGETGAGTEPSGTTDTGTSNDLIELDVDVDTSGGGGSADLSVGGEPVAETDVSTGTDLSGTTEPVIEEASTTLDAGVVTDKTTIDASTETTEDSLTIDVSAGSDTLGDALLGTGSEVDPDATTAEETTDVLDDCSLLDPLSLPDHCL